MAKMTERSLRARDAKRNVGAELLASVREMKAGKVCRANVSRSCWASRRARCRNGSRGAVTRRGPPARC